MLTRKARLSKELEVTGYPIEWFVDPPERTKCAICLNILNEPRQCKNGHLFCLGCMKTALKTNKAFCPMCRTSILEKDLILNIFAAEAISESLVFCNCVESNITGCKWRGTLKCRASRDCEFQLVKCSNSGCNQWIQRREFETHVHSKCQVRLDACKHCGEGMQHNLVPEHESICTKRELKEPKHIEKCLVEATPQHNSSKCTVVDLCKDDISRVSKKQKTVISCEGDFRTHLQEIQSDSSASIASAPANVDTSASTVTSTPPSAQPFLEIVPFNPVKINHVVAQSNSNRTDSDIPVVSNRIHLEPTNILSSVIRNSTASKSSGTTKKSLNLMAHAAFYGYPGGCKMFMMILGNIADYEAYDTAGDDRCRKDLERLLVRHPELLVECVKVYPQLVRAKRSDRQSNMSGSSTPSKISPCGYIHDEAVASRMLTSSDIDSSVSRSVMSDVTISMPSTRPLSTTLPARITLVSVHNVEQGCPVNGTSAINGQDINNNLQTSPYFESNHKKNWRVSRALLDTPMKQNAGIDTTNTITHPTPIMRTDVDKEQTRYEMKAPSRVQCADTGGLVHIETLKQLVKEAFNGYSRHHHQMFNRLLKAIVECTKDKVELNDFCRNELEKLLEGHPDVMEQCIKVFPQLIRG